MRVSAAAGDSITLLDMRGLRTAVELLAARDPRLSAIVARHGVPPLWPREPGFETLVRIILEQQVSLDSGRAAFERIERSGGSVTPETILALGEGGLRAVGITRQKARYLVALARQVAAGDLDLDALVGHPDDAARAALMTVPGIGPWTADVYLLLALRRPDTWPSGDIALAAAARDALELDTRPGPVELTALAEPWRPWRAVAARLLWHSYLSERALVRRGRSPQDTSR
jgi:DNA-3-methyladenine glycosylase II